MMKKFFTLLLMVGLAVLVSAQNETKFSKKQLKQDLNYLYKTLQKTHYDLYAHISKKAYDKAYRQLRRSFKDSLNVLETYRLFQPFVALTKMAHCTTNYPFQRAYGAFIGEGGKLFPLNITVYKEKAYIKVNYSENKQIQKGAELLEINGVAIQKTLDKMYNYLSGDNTYLQNTILDIYSFPRWYWAINDGVEEYDVKVKNRDGQVKSFKLKAITALKFEETYAKEEALFDQSREFKFLSESTAYLKPGAFSNLKSDGNSSKTETFDKGRFLKFIENAFTKIKQKNAKNLIIDLRNNSGGSNTFSDEMLAYIAHKKFRFCSDFKIKVSEITKQYWRKVKDNNESEMVKSLKKEILAHKNGERFNFKMPYHMPRQDDLTFKGKVYVLINRYSYSQATITAAMVQDFGFGTLVGETTADVATTYGAVHQFSLPNSKIAITYPKALIVRPNGDEKPKGVTPDHLVNENLFTKKDEILEFTMELIKGEMIKSGGEQHIHRLYLDK